MRIGGSFGNRWKAQSMCQTHRDVYKLHFHFVLYCAVFEGTIDEWIQGINNDVKVLIIQINGVFVFNQLGN